MPGSARLVRLEADQGIWLPRVRQPLLSHRRLPSCTVPEAQSCLPTAKLFSHCRRPRFTHRTQQCQFIIASLVSDAVFFGCPWGSVRKPQCVLCMPKGPKKFGAEAFKSAGFFGILSDLARPPPGPGLCWLLSGGPLQFGAGPLRDLAFVRGTPPLGAGPSVAWLLSRAPFHFGAGPVLAWFLSR